MELFGWPHRGQASLPRVQRVFPRSSGVKGPGSAVFYDRHQKGLGIWHPGYCLTANIGIRPRKWLKLKLQQGGPENQARVPLD